jgi:glutamate dehydrogenase/leucine dehydrogenase
MGHILDEYEQLVGKSTPAVVTGKPLSLGGIVGRETATADGGVFILEQLLSRLSAPKQKEKRVLVQGFGNAGFYATRALYRQGYQIVGIADSQTGLYDPAGLDPEKVKKVKEAEGLVAYPKASGSSGAKLVSHEEFLLLPTDILVPAALDGQLRADNAAQVQAKIILELANGPTTPEADEIFAERNIIVIPDILANAGGVTVSYFEWQQNLQGQRWEEVKVRQNLEAVLGAAFAAVWERAKKESVPLRLASWLLGVERLNEAMDARGEKIKK